MNSIIKYKFYYYKNLILKKPITYLIILFSSLIIITCLWISKTNDTNLNITLDECTIPESGEDKCQYIKNHCSDIEGLFNYLSFIYCSMSKYNFFAMIIMIFWIIWLFLLFGTSASSFFSPNLTVIANYLHLPESVAGVTLAALGNGAPDVFGTFSSFKANSGGLAIGELIGASLFVTILVIGSISLVSPLKVSKKPFLCDMLFFIGAVICVLILLIKGYISSIDSMIMLGYYIIYVVMVVIINWRKQIKKSRIENYHSLGFRFPRYEFESDSEEIYNDADIDDSSDFSESSSESFSSLSSNEFNENKNILNLENESLIVNNSKKINNTEIIITPQYYDTSNNKENEFGNKNDNDDENDDEIDDENAPLLNNETGQYLSSHVNINNYFENENRSNTLTSNTNSCKKNSKSFKEKLIHTLFPYFKDWHHQSTFTKCINLFCMPFNLILTLTIPVITPEIHKAYTIQVNKEKEKSESTMHQRRRHRNKRRHYHHHRPKSSKENIHHKVNSVFNEKRETEHSEKLKKQQLSRIVSESKLKNPLSRSTSFEEINNLVREGMMKKQQRLNQNKISRSFTNYNLYSINNIGNENEHDHEHGHEHIVEHPLKKSQSLNLIKMKKKYKALSIHDPDNNLYQKAIRNTSYLNSQKQKEKELSMNFDTSNSYYSLALDLNISPPKFIDIKKSTKESGGVIFKEFTASDSSNNSSPNRDSLSEYESSHSPSKFQYKLQHFTPLNQNQNQNQNLNQNQINITSNIYPSASPPSNYNNSISIQSNSNNNTNTNTNTNTNNNNNNNNNNSLIQNQSYAIMGDTSTSSSPKKNNMFLNRVMSISSINNYDFNDINEYNSYFMETNNITMSSFNYSYNDLNSIYSNSFTDVSVIEPLLNQDTNYNSQNKGTLNENETSNTNNELTFHIDSPIILSEVWNKWLIVLPTTICPLFITLICSIDLDIEYYHWILSCALSLVFFLLTSIYLKNDQIPSCYCIFSIIGFISGLTWIYVIANEVVAVLQSLGKILRISDSIMGLSFFAMGNSLGDLITNVSIAKMGFSKMAIGACLGTPLLNIILGLGVSGIILTEKKHKPLPIKIDSNALYFSVIGLLICAIATLFYVYFNNFKMTRSYGLCAIIIYSLIVIIQVIIEISYK